MKPKSMVQGPQSQQGAWSWLDRVQTKLESLYETEQGGSVFLQETGRMFESQVTRVGANVKKLYSEFVRELLLPLDVAGESQAWADAQARSKAPAIASAGEEVTGEDQPATALAKGKATRGDQPDAEGLVEKAAEEELSEAEVVRDCHAQGDEEDKAASETLVSNSQEFEVLQPPLFQAPPVEETHEDLRVKEGVTKLHLKLQEMQRISSDKTSAEEPAPTSDTESAEPSTDNAPRGAHPDLAVAPYAGHSDSVSAAKLPDGVQSDPTTDLDAADLEFASETEGESGREDMFSGNESDRSERAKWYGAKRVLPRQGSGSSTEQKGGWFDWELV